MKTGNKIGQYLGILEGFHLGFLVYGNQPVAGENSRISHFYYFYAFGKYDVITQVILGTWRNKTQGVLVGMHGNKLGTGYIYIGYLTQAFAFKLFLLVLNIHSQFNFFFIHIPVEFIHKADILIHREFHL
ncbi:MAG: hypothetical protein BWY70_00645 [Bacteroidetes bacterium ADurb.Bin408]|nr:MAG: hypothetical protein BWY70_00645 [Bacteroidetes bacterium ADurb.Bin408]